jgi:hypothetical protein
MRESKTCSFFAAASRSQLHLSVLCRTDFALIALQPSKLDLLSPDLAGYLA